MAPPVPPVPPAVPSISAKEFLQAIWGNEKGTAELTIIGSKIRKGGFKVAYPFSIDSFLSAANNHNRTDNVYMGVCLRREPWASNSRGTEALALSCGCVWAEFDFAEHGHKGRTVPEEVARKMLKEFPLVPSIIIRSGGGIQVYWLTKEAVVGNDLWRLKVVNRALAKYFQADPQSTDLARVLRIPWTMNHNYDPNRQVQIGWWKPDKKYILDDFDFLPQEDVASVAPASTQAAAAAAQTASPPHSSHATPLKTGKKLSAQEARRTPVTKLEDDDCVEIGTLFSEIWFEGWRHELALCVAGWLANAGVSVESAKAIITIASQKTQGNTHKRVKDVEDTYRRFNAGEELPVKGKTSMVSMVNETFPEIAKKKALSVINHIQKILPQTQGHSKTPTEADFQILHLIKFNSIPARWTVTLEKGGKELIATTEHSRFMKYEVFLEDVLDQNTVVPEAALKNHEWRAKINEAISNGLFEEQEAPAEARPAGAIEDCLIHFMAESKESPDIGLLKKFPGHDDENSFFRFNTFQTYLEEQGHKVSKNHLMEKLKSMGWKSDPKRFGKKVERVWLKSVLQGGGPNGNGNGAPLSPPPAPAAPEAPSAAQTPVTPEQDPSAAADAQRGLFKAEVGS
jgi:hypothetical protein